MAEVPKNGYIFISSRGLLRPLRGSGFALGQPDRLRRQAHLELGLADVAHEAARLLTTFFSFISRRSWGWHPSTARVLSQAKSREKTFETFWSRALADKTATPHLSIRRRDGLNENSPEMKKSLDAL